MRTGSAYLHQCMIEHITRKQHRERRLAQNLCSFPTRFNSSCLLFILCWVGSTLYQQHGLYKTADGTLPSSTSNKGLMQILQITKHALFLYSVMSVVRSEDKSKLIKVFIWFLGSNTPSNLRNGDFKREKFPTEQGKMVWGYYHTYHLQYLG